MSSINELACNVQGATNESRVGGSAATAPTPDCTVAAHCPQEVGKLAGLPLNPSCVVRAAHHGALPGCVHPKRPQHQDCKRRHRAGDSHAHQCRSPATHMEAVSTDHADGKPLHKPRVVWTDELHQRFLRAIEAAGSEEAAVPTVILRVCLQPQMIADPVSCVCRSHDCGYRVGCGQQCDGGCVCAAHECERPQP